jgi:ATP-dependent DNA helicase PIF1
MIDATPSNLIADKVLEFIEYTSQNIFLTGKAGTGKTTLLRKIQASTTKKMAILAPTGVAAMNAKGTTINSFFQLPPGSFFPGDISIENLQSGILSIQSMVADLSYSKDKTDLFRLLELLVIDEVSMVRCDLLDVIDAILRKVRGNNTAFGGVQLLLIGDLYQLPPVTKREEWSFLNRAYASPYFFDAQVIRRNPVLQVELTQVYRQTEPAFINILNDIRNNSITETSLKLLNERYDPNFQATEELNPIIITSHNAEANAINKQKLEELPDQEYTFEGETSGAFRDLGLQAEQSLKLKVGAQVMFIKNDVGENRRYYNGKIGKIKSISIDASEIYIAFPGEEDMLLKKSAWQSFEYKAEGDEEIMQQQVGEFTQYPIKLAWAVTIHKSQGLTFDHAIIDAGKSFIAGQVYVALSRVRTLNGLILRSKISTESLRSNPEVINFIRPATVEILTNNITTAQERFILQLILKNYTLVSVQDALELLLNNADLKKASMPELQIALGQMEKSINDLSILLAKFHTQILSLHETKGFDQALLGSRLEAALLYFSKELTTQVLNLLNKNIRVKAKTKVQQHLQQLLIKFRQTVEQRMFQMQQSLELLKQPVAPDQYISWISKQKAQVHPKPASASDNNNAVNLQLF